jgi:L-amino acid N-acyltransferase YncA
MTANQIDPADQPCPDFVVRPAAPADAASILAIYAPFCDSTVVSFEETAPTEVQMRERIIKILHAFPWLVGEINGRVAGYVYASQHRERAAYRWSVDVAVYVDPSYRRRGLGRSLYDALFAILREQGFFRAYASITLPNESSVGLHESAGFLPLAVFPGVGYKLGNWLDVGWWHRELQPSVAMPAMPRSFHEIQNSQVVLDILKANARQPKTRPQ